MVETPYVAVLRAGLTRCCRLRADLEQELAELAESTAGGPDDEHDPEGSTVGYERARVMALLARTCQEIDDLTEALARATRDRTEPGDPPYGRCRRCGARIGAERLTAVPATLTCASCAGPPAPGGMRLVR